MAGFQNAHHAFKRNRKEANPSAHLMLARNVEQTLGSVLKINNIAISSVVKADPASQEVL